MVQLTATIQKFGAQGEKTGWTYLLIPCELAQKLNPGSRKSFKVKGTIDNYSFKGINLLPMGEGDYILTLNAASKKGIRKNIGAEVNIQLQRDESPFIFNPDLIKCLQEEPEVYKRFTSLPLSYQRYYSKWIDEAKSKETVANRIAKTFTIILTEASKKIKKQDN